MPQLEVFQPLPPKRWAASARKSTPICAHAHAGVQVGLRRWSCGGGILLPGLVLPVLFILPHHPSSIHHPSFIHHLFSIQHPSFIHPLLLLHPDPSSIQHPSLIHPTSIIHLAFIHHPSNNHLSPIHCPSPPTLSLCFGAPPLRLSLARTILNDLPCA